MNLNMFYEQLESGEVVISNRPEAKSLHDVVLVTELHASNSSMHHVIDRFIELYADTLQWLWFDEYQSWLKRKEDYELLPTVQEDGEEITPPPFTEAEPVRPVIKTIDQYKSEIMVHGFSIEEYIFRVQRSAAVNSITVDVDGLVFDGDEQSQRRMLAAIHVAEEGVITQTIWRMADNSEQVVTLDQLKEAHSKAIIAQGKLWTKA